ncbi:MAG: hypothetical protein P4L40_03345 [Terracidiphilus sp.]|nr:hypothetical protein [Terracidiphilus sp.]
MHRLQRLSESLCPVFPWCVCLGGCVPVGVCVCVCVCVCVRD